MLSIQNSMSLIIEFYVMYLKKTFYKDSDEISIDLLYLLQSEKD